MAASTSEAREIAGLKAQVAQLTGALDSRVRIEQAKGVVAERYLLNLDGAFALVRTCARSERRGLDGVAADVVTSVATRDCPVARYVKPKRPRTRKP